MSVSPPEDLRAVCDALYHWRGREVLGAKDVLCWVRLPKSSTWRYGIAFWGDALTMKLRAMTRALPNADGSLDLSLQRALGMPARSTRIGGRLHPEMQTMSYPDVYLTEVLSAVSSLASELLGEESIAVATLMPSEGTPWSPENSPTPYYSAKRGKVSKTAKPDYLIMVESSEGRQLGANFCAVAPVISHCRTDAVAARFAGRRDEPFLVTHCADVFEKHGVKPKDTAKEIVSCGGVLYPSTAIALVPATNYGELVLVCDPSIILPSMRPYKRRGRWPVAVYETDVWTETTRYFFGEGAVGLLRELTDVDDEYFMYKRDFHVLGPAVNPERNKLVGSTKSLRTTIAKRAREYTRDLDEKGLEQVRYGNFERPGWYAYLEAKVAGIAAMDCYPLAVCPKGETRRVKSFLSGIGFSGDLISVERPPKVAGRDERWDYAWRVRDAVLAYADRDPDRFVLSLEE